jgi:hypothetical protein
LQLLAADLTQGELIRGASRAAARRIESVTRDLKDLPLPARVCEREDALPRPAEPAGVSVQGLPGAAGAPAEEV